jgi:hypothetical protein
MRTYDATMDDADFVRGLQEAEITDALTHVLMLLRTQTYSVMLGVRLLLHDDSGSVGDSHATLTKLVEHLERSEALIAATRHHIVPRLRVPG